MLYNIIFNYGWIITLVLGGLLIICFYYLTICNLHYWKNRGFPYVTIIPFIDYYMNMFLHKKTIRDKMTDIYNKYRGHKFIGFILFHHPVLMILNRELINHILITDFNHFHDNLSTMGNWEPLSSYLSNLRGDYWKNIRHKLTPTFSSMKVKLMFDQIDHCVTLIKMYIQKKQDTWDAKVLTEKFNIHVIANVALGLGPECCKENGKRDLLFEICKIYFTPSLKKELKFMLYSSFPKLSKFLKIKLIQSEVSDFFVNLVRDTMEYRKKNGKRRNDFLQLIMDIKVNEETEKLVKTNQSEIKRSRDTYLSENLKNVSLEVPNKFVFTDPVIASQIYSFLGLGGEVISHTLSLALYELAVNQDIQLHLQNDIDTILSNEILSYDSLKKLTYLDQFLYEVMRMYPFMTCLIKQCTNDYVIPGTNKVIEKGMVVVIPTSALNKDPTYFPEPNKFNPDRFEDMNSLPKGAFFPFGTGPRACIAIRLVILEMKIFLSRLLSEYNITLSNTTKLPLKIIYNSKVSHVDGGIFVNFKPRNLE